MDINITETASVFVMGAWDSGGDSEESADNTGANFYAPWGGDWAVWGGTAIKLNEKATFNAEVGYDDFEDFSAVANVAYELVPGFRITPEIAYYDNFDEEDVELREGATSASSATSNQPQAADLTNPAGNRRVFVYPMPKRALPGRLLCRGRRIGAGEKAGDAIGQVQRLQHRRMALAGDGERLQPAMPAAHLRYRLG